MIAFVLTPGSGGTMPGPGGILSGSGGTMPRTLGILMPRMAGGLVTAGGTTGAQGAAGQSVPAPDLSAVEPNVRNWLLECRRQVEGLPRSAANWGRFGIVLEAHGFQAEARVAYSEAARNDPTEFRWTYLLAVLLESSDEAAAESWLRAAIELRPSYAPAQIRMGELLERQGRSAEARPFFVRAGRLDPDNPFAPFGLGRLLLAEGETGAAIVELERARRLNPEVGAILATLSQAYFRAGDKARAQEIAAEARPLPRTTYRPDTVKAEVAAAAVDFASYLRRARALREVGQLDEALQQVEVAGRLRPQMPEVYYLEALIRDDRGEAEQAVAAARRTLALDPEMDDIRPVLAGNLLNLGQFSEARSEAERVLQDHPHEVRMVLVLAVAAMSSRDAVAWVQALDRAWEIGTGNRAMRGLLRDQMLELSGVMADSGLYWDAALWMERVVEVSRLLGENGARQADYARRLEEYRRLQGG